MKSTKVFCFWVAAALFLSGCAKEPVPVPATQECLIPINISGFVGSSHTKSSSAGFNNNDAIGLFAVNRLNNNSEPGVLISSGNQADNIKYTFSASDQSWTPSSPVYYKDADTHADIYTYFPYTTSITDVNEYEFEVSQDQSALSNEGSLSGYEASDFLWGKVSNITPVQSRVEISFSHKMSSVQVLLKEKENNSGFNPGEFDGLEKSAILTNTVRTAKIDLSTGEVSPSGSPDNTGIVMRPTENNSFKAIVVPQSISAGTQLFSFLIDGVPYSYKTSGETTFSSGKTNTFTLSVSKKIVAVSSVSLNKNNISIILGETSRLSATIKPAYATDKTVIWSSDNPSIAEVDQTGTITAKAYGKTTITVTTNDGGKKASCTISVIAEGDMETPEEGGEWGW